MSHPSQRATPIRAATQPAPTRPTAHPPVTRVSRGRYTTDEVLGRGAMGTVFRGRDRALGRDVAVKRLHRELASHRLYTTALRREACAGARIDHPNVVRVLDAGREHGQTPIIVMELLDARSLADALTEAPQPPLEWSVRILAQLLSGLAAAHAAGIIHRDVKPENLLLQRTLHRDGTTRDVVKLCDFGIAHVPGMHLIDDDGTPISLEGLGCGTPDYMAPEQVAGDSVDQRADLYAAGVILHGLVTGAAADGQRFEPGPGFPRRLTRPTALCPSLPAALETVIVRATRPIPAHRYDTAGEMRDALLGALELPLATGAPLSLGTGPAGDPSGDATHDPAGDASGVRSRAGLQAHRAGSPRRAVAPPATFAGRAGVLLIAAVTALGLAWVLY